MSVQVEEQIPDVVVEQPTGLQIEDGKEVIVKKKVGRKQKEPKPLGEDKKKRVHVWTDSKKAAFEKCRAARLKNIAERKEKEKEQALDKKE